VADGRHLENQKSYDISKTVWPILTKIYPMMHIDPPDHICSKAPIFRNPRWWTAANLKTIRCNISKSV